MSTTTQQKKSRPAAVKVGPRVPRLRRVFVHELEIVGSIGVFEHEKRYEQRILISADLWVRDDYDGRSDRLADVLDYGKVMDAIVVLAQAEHVNLNETLAERIAQQCLADPRVEGVRVTIAKPDVAHSCKSVGIEIERWRE
jgi:dihydroneopterin aldolase